jgi:ligand-binding sensor domain-containing protein
MKNPIQVATIACVLTITFMGYGQWVETGGPASNVTRVLTVRNNAIFAGTDDGMFRSANNGSEWTAINAGMAKDTVLACGTTDSSIFIGTFHNGVFRSTNNGASWTAANIGFPKDSFDTGSFSPVNSFAAIGGTLLAGTFQKGIFLTGNNGASWSPINSGLTNTNVYALVASGNNFFSGTGAGGGVFLSSNNGSAWSAVNNGLSYIVKMVYSVLTLTANENGLFAGTFSGGIYSSTNNGASWKSANTGLAANTVLSLLAYGNILFAGTDFSGIFISRDNGASWASFSGGLPDNHAVVCLCVSDSSLFAGIYGSGVWRRPLSSMSPAPSAVALLKSSAGNGFGISGASGMIRYTLPVASHVSIKYFDCAGRLMASLVNHGQAAGSYFLASPSLPNGFYIRDFRAGSFTQRDRVN